MIQLYAITDADSVPPPPELVGLRAVRAGELAAICSEAPVGDVTPELLWRHEETVEALMEGRDILPVRYGTQVADETALTRILEENHERLRERLGCVRGAAEASVRAFTDDPPAAVDLEHSTGIGTGYLRARARAAEAERDAARVIHEPLSAVARAGTLKRASLQGEVLCAAYLLDRDAVVRFGEQVAELQRATPELRLVCTGPWPPYSFAEQ